ncbi:MAG: urea transporter [Deltaproteobacteria bacterium]|nr:urea transporter [Deltaproteobacteria bacterium]
MNLVRWLAAGVVRSYAQILFSRSLLVGALLMLATFTAPWMGAVGLLGVSATLLLGRGLGFDRAATEGGLLGYNPLLLFLGMALVVEGSEWWALAPLGVLGVLGIHVALEGGLRYHLRLPVLSVPFVLASWLFLSLLVAARGELVFLHLSTVGVAPLPWGDAFLQTFGALLFLPHWLPGLIVLIALVVHTRIGAVHGLFSLLAAWGLSRSLGLTDALFVQVLGFNALLSGLALGGVLFIPSLGSLLLAVAGGAMSVGLGLGALELLRPWGLPLLTVPFNAVVLVATYALGQRLGDRPPRLAERVEASPEETLHRFRTRVQRFQTAVSVRLRLPFRGAWTCTQGNDGEHTHRGLWRHGLDFEVQDRAGARFSGDGARVEDWHCYRLPVVAMAAGTVVRVVDGVPDNAPGEMNLAANWGNLVMVHYGVDLFGMVAHLSPGSLQVKEGQVVSAGQVLGLCGASGRSPVPHLHVQLQRTPVVGDPTVPIAFHDVVIGDEPTSLSREHLPAEGELIRNADGASALAGALAWPMGFRMMAEVETGEGARWREEITSHVDLLGRRSLRSDRGGVLWFEVGERSFVIYDHEGSRDSALYGLYAALARVPFDSARELEWDDLLNPRRLSSSVRTWTADLLAAFVPVRSQPIAYRWRVEGEQRVVLGEAALPRGRALRTSAEFQGAELTRISVDNGSRALRATLEVVR